MIFGVVFGPTDDNINDDGDSGKQEGPLNIVPSELCGGGAVFGFRSLSATSNESPSIVVALSFVCPSILLQNYSSASFGAI